MAMVDMKRTKADKAAQKKRYDTIGGIGGEDYHHGLGVSLGHEELSKLGISEMPQVGDKLQVTAHAHVTSASENHRDGGQKERRIELQLRQMEVSAVKRAQNEDVHEGKLRGAKAAMDQALDKQEGEKD